jgi:hypothetical protein
VDLREFIKKRGWTPLKLNPSEVSELACRVQIGTPLEQVLLDLREVLLVARPAGIHYRREGAQVVREREVEQARPADAIQAELGQIARSQEDKAKEIRRLYGFYDELCAEEFDSPGAVWAKLKEIEFDKKGGLAYYKYMRPFYFARGVLDPPKALRDMVHDVKFLGEVTVVNGAQRALVDVFDRAETELESFPVIGKLLKRSVIDSIPVTTTSKGKRVRLIGGWNPRPRTDNQGNPEALSPHALGFATDIKPVTNEHLKGKKADAIDAVLAYLNSQGKFPENYRVKTALINYEDIEKEEGNPAKQVQMALDVWTRIKTISGAFQRFVSLNLPKHQKKQPIDPVVDTLIVECIRQFGVGKLEFIVKNGLYDEHVLLVVAMIRAGARYGGEFKTTKDQHHFEVRNWQRNFVRPRCIDDLLSKRKASRP